MVAAGKQVLVVDADPLWRAMLERVIARTDGLACSGSVATTREAREHVVHDAPAVALVAAAHVTRLAPALVAEGSRVVVLYDWPDVLAPTHAQLLGASGCVQRGAPAEEIAEVLVEVASGTPCFRCS
jgi:DNA-binding NarL/FixJ family response regulator